VRQRADRGEDGDADEGDRDGEGVGEREPDVGCERHGVGGYPQGGCRTPYLRGP